MLPEPKRVAKVLQRLLRSREERQQQDELQRQVQVRLGKARLRRHLGQQREMEARLKSLARRALSLNDEARFRQLGRQLLWTRRDMVRWERYLLTLEMLEARRDQLRASVELLQSVKAMSASLNELAAPQPAQDLQQELELGLARAASLEERMAIMMEMVDATLEGDVQLEPLSGLEQELAAEIVGQEAADFDSQVEAELGQIRSELARAEK